jgi:MFS family permease
MTQIQERTMADSAPRTILSVLHAVVAGLAAASIAVLGPLVVGFVATWTFNYFGWIRARDLAARIPSYFTVFVVLGVAVGLTTCLRVLGSRFRREPDSPKLK